MEALEDYWTIPDIKPVREFVSKVEELKPAKELDFDATPGFGDYKIFFPKEAVAHPAKMNTRLLEYLILHYTEPGHVVADPMGGTGSTGVLAALHGRNAVVVELEEKFTVWAEKAKARVDGAPTLNPKGQIRIVKGDARKLSEVLSGSDVALMSPPYGKTVSRTGKGGDDEHPERRLNQHPNAWLPEAKYSDDPTNIGNLDHGDVDAVVTSPPFSDTLHPRKGMLDEKGMLNAVEKMRKEGYDEKYIQGSFQQPNQQLALAKDGYSQDAGNIGNLKHGEVDAIVSSPPYHTRTDGEGLNRTGIPNARGVNKKRAETLKYSDDHNNIGEITAYGGLTQEELEAFGKKTVAKIANGESVDVVISSPTYGPTHPTASREELFKRLAEDPTSNRYGRKSHPTTAAPYSESAQNIGNLPPGDIDSVVTSPPYAHSANGPDRSEFYERMATDDRAHGPDRYRKKPHPDSAKAYSQSKDNIGNLAPGNIDTVVSSPPYEGSEAFQDTDFKVKIADDQNERKRAGLIKGHPTAAFRTLKYKSGGHISQGHAVSESAEAEYMARVAKGRVEHPDSIGKLSKETYLEAMLKVYSEMHKVLKPGGRAVIVVKPFSRDRKVVDLPWQTWLLLEKVGFAFEDVVKLRLQKFSFWRILQYKKDPSLEQIRHEYCLVVRKQP